MTYKINESRKRLYAKYWLEEGAIKPTKAHSADAGFDIYIPEARKIRAKGSLTVDTGVHILIPDGYVGFLKSKSGLNVKHSLRGEGVIDAGYTGTITVKMYNDSFKSHKFEKGDKLIQLVILPIPDVELDDMLPGDFFDLETERGTNGFGSSGR